MHRYYLIVLAFLATPLAVSAQTATPPAQPFEIVHNDIDMEVAPNGKTYLAQTIAYRALDDMGVRELQQFTFSYTKDYQSLSITAYTLKKDGRRIDVPQSDILRGHGETTKPGYQDTRTENVVFPDVEVGDQVVLQILRCQLVPWFTNVVAVDFVMHPDVVTREASVAITTEGNDAAFHIRASGMRADPVQHGGGKTRHVWHFHNDVAEKPETGVVQTLDDVPHVSVTTLPDYGAVARLYADLFRDKAQVTPEITKRADSITSGIRGHRAQAKALYDWVATHIQYVDIVLGAGGFVPASAADVLKDDYGDCKAHVMLLKALLAAKGIDSSAVLIQPDNSGDALPASPSPFRFSHLINYIPEFRLYLDSTARHAPFGVLPASDAGKSVVIVQSGKVAKTPLVTQDNSTIKINTDLIVNADGSADDDTVYDTTGALAVTMRTLIAALPSNIDDNYLRSIFGPGSDAKLQRGNLQDMTNDYTYSMHYHIAHFGQMPGPGAFSIDIPASFLPLIGSGIPHTKPYACTNGTFIESVNVRLPAGSDFVAIPASQTLTAPDVQLHTVFQKKMPGVLHLRLALRENHPGPVCRPAYFAGAQAELAKMTEALQAKVLYK